MDYLSTIDEIRAACRKSGVLQPCNERPLPRRGIIIRSLHDIKGILFPGYFNRLLTDEEASQELKRVLCQMKEEMTVAYLLNGEEPGDVMERFLEELPRIHRLTLKDIDAARRRDPAANSAEEVLLSYPGVTAIFIHRIAHFFYLEGVPLIPRMMSEYAHTITGIDIHPGAQIGESFFIDHGTGVVIGETSVIGDGVTMYQGVTIGAKSIYEDMDTSIKRHPTIEDGVVIYAGAKILGGDTVVGQGSLIGGNVFLAHSVDPYSTVTMKNGDENVIRKKD